MPESKITQVEQSIKSDWLDRHGKAYSEACNTLRHYSNASLTVRVLSVVQGIAILAAWAYALTQKISPLMIVFPIAGLLFTVLLYRFHIGYFRATVFFYDKAAQLEEKLFDSGFRPIAAYHKRHDEVYGNIWGKLFTFKCSVRAYWDPFRACVSHNIMGIEIWCLNGTRAAVNSYVGSTFHSIELPP